MTKQQLAHRVLALRNRIDQESIAINHSGASSSQRERDLFHLIGTVMGELFMVAVEVDVDTVKAEREKTERRAA